MLQELNSNFIIKNRARIGILGGTFDPIHNAHIELALAAKKQFDLDIVYLLVSGQPPHKLKKKKTDAMLRFEMVKLACNEHNGLLADDYEIKNNGIDYTYLSLEHFCDKYKDTDIFFIIGEDSLFEIESWKNPEIIMSLAHILVAKREGSSCSSDIAEQIKYLSLKYNADIEFISEKIDFISSTVIRERFNKGLKCDSFVPKIVIDFINKKGLYRNDRK